MYDQMQHSDIYTSEIDMALHTLPFELDDYKAFYENKTITEEEWEQVQEHFRKDE